MSGENWNPIRFKSQPSRGGVIEDVLFEDIDIRQARNVFEVNMSWRMKGATEPPYKPLTTLRNIRFRNVTAHAENAGLFRGYEEQPLTPEIFSFENCRLYVKTPLQLQFASLDLQGLDIITENH